MVTVYDKDGNEIRLDGCDARQRIAAGLAFANPPEKEQPKAKKSAK